MTLLEVITKASANLELAASQLSYPIILDANDVILNLKPTVENPNPAALVHRVSGWKISRKDSDTIKSAGKFVKTLKQMMENPNELRKDVFIGMLNQFLEKAEGIFGVTVDAGPAEQWCTSLIEKVGAMMGRDVAGLVLEACLLLEIWEVVRALIVKEIVENSSYPKLVASLVEKRKSDLLCLCIQHATVLGSPELLCIMKYFLCPHADAYSSMLPVRKEWETTGLLAIDKAMDENLARSESLVAREASILLMVAYDGFTSSELCLHYLLGSGNVDEVALSSALGKLSGKEMKRLLQYLIKWLNKYDKFPEAAPSPTATEVLGFKGCSRVPKIGHVVKFLGSLLDENYSSMVLLPEFHEDLRLVAASVSSLAMEAKVCCLVASVAEKLQVDIKDAIK